MNKGLQWVRGHTRGLSGGTEYQMDWEQQTQKLRGWSKFGVFKKDKGPWGWTSAYFPEIFEDNTIDP